MEKDSKKDAKTRLLLLEFGKSGDEIRKRLVRANAKLAAVRDALPNNSTTALWEGGPTMLVQKIRAIIEAP